MSSAEEKAAAAADEGAIAAAESDDEQSAIDSADEQQAEGDQKGGTERGEDVDKDEDVSSVEDSEEEEEEEEEEESEDEPLTDEEGKAAEGEGQDGDADQAEGGDADQADGEDGQDGKAAEDAMSLVERKRQEREEELSKLGPEERKEYDAQTVIAKVARRYIASRELGWRLRSVFKRVYDPKYDMYFFYNLNTEESIWQPPILLKGEKWIENDDEASITIQNMARCFIARKRVAKAFAKRYRKCFDVDRDRWYYVNKRTEKTTWKPPALEGRFEIPASKEDAALYLAQQRVRELEQALLQQQEEYSKLREARFDELEPEILAERVERTRDEPRSHHMDEWSVEQLSAFFEDYNMAEYVPWIQKNRIDGDLFVQLEDEDWPDMGITNKVHTRKLQLLMKAYRYRFEKRKARREHELEDELLSEYTPSELSEMMMEEAGQDEIMDGGFGGDSIDDDGSMSLEAGVALAEQRLRDEQRKIEEDLDSRNIAIDVIAEGSGTRPSMGDVVEINYKLFLPDGTMVACSKDPRSGAQRPQTFALGSKQILKGLDRALPKMRVGDHSLVRISAEYGYGSEGLRPLIPPNTELVFDVIVLSHHPRPKWVKPLIQRPGLSEKPYVAMPDSDSDWDSEDDYYDDDGYSGTGSRRGTRRTSDRGGSRRASSRRKTSKRGSTRKSSRRGDSSRKPSGRKPSGGGPTNSRRESGRNSKTGATA